MKTTSIIAACVIGSLLVFVIRFFAPKAAYYFAEPVECVSVDGDEMCLDQYRWPLACIFQEQAGELSPVCLELREVVRKNTRVVRFNAFGQHIEITRVFGNGNLMAEATKPEPQVTIRPRPE